MIRVDKNSVNSIVVFEANDNDRTHWLIVATHTITCTEEVFIVALTLQSSRCLQFDITDGTPEDQLNAIVNFIGGDWTFDFYKQPLATQETNLDRNLATLEFSRQTKVEGTDCPPMAAPSQCPDVVVTDGANDVSVGAGGTYTCLPAVCADATYENSDQSFTQNIASGATFVASDVSHIDSDGTPTPTPANSVFTCIPGVSVSGIGYQRPQIRMIASSFSTDDENSLRGQGVLDFNSPANVAQVQALDMANLDPFRTLLFNNDFGNKDRFTDTQGGQTYGAGNGSLTDYIVCNLTGIAIYRVNTGNANWATSLTNATSSTQHGFTDWYIPPSDVLGSFMCWDTNIISATNRSLNYTPVSINTPRVRSSSTDIQSTANCRTVDGGVEGNRAKTFSEVTYMVRNHF